MLQNGKKKRKPFKCKYTTRNHKKTKLFGFSVFTNIDRSTHPVFIVTIKISTCLQVVCSIFLNVVVRCLTICALDAVSFLILKVIGWFTAWSCSLYARSIARTTFGCCSVGLRIKTRWPPNWCSSAYVSAVVRPRRRGPCGRCTWNSEPRCARGLGF